MSDDHEISALPEKHQVRSEAVTRYRGRCSCGAVSFMHYGTKQAARTALRRTHMISVDANSSDDSGND